MAAGRPSKDKPRREYAEPKIKEFVKGWFDALSAFSWACVSNGFGVHGIPDRVGCVPVTITPEMVGKRVGLFVAIEAKGTHREREKDGGVSGPQREKIREIQAAGGLAGVVWHPDQLANFEMKKWLTRLMTLKQ